MTFHGHIVFSKWEVSKAIIQKTKCVLESIKIFFLNDANHCIYRTTSLSSNNL